MMDIEVNTEKYVGIVPFRSGSKGLPNKHGLNIFNKPLWEWTVDQSCRFFRHTIVSTDALLDDLDQPIQRFVYDQRPSELATDGARMSEVVSYLIKTYALEDKNIALLQATSPLRIDSDIEAAIKKFETGKYSSITTVTEVPNNFLKYCISDGDYIKPMENSAYFNENRQTLPKTFSPVGSIFIFKASDFLVHKKIPTEIMGYVEIAKERSIDIDDLTTFRLANKYIVENTDQFVI